MVKNPLASVGDEETRLIPRLGRSAGVRIGNPLQYSCLTKPMVRGIWQATVRGVTKGSDTIEWLNTHTDRHSIGSSSVVAYTLSQFSFLKANPFLVIELWDTAYLVTWRICVVIDRAKGMLSQMQYVFLYLFFFCFKTLAQNSLGKKAVHATINDHTGGHSWSKLPSKALRSWKLTNRIQPPPLDLAKKNASSLQGKSF